MARSARPTHLTDAQEASITILSSLHEGADPKFTLLNGVVGSGLSNATLLNWGGYLEFSCSEKIILWACGAYYSDSGGNSGTGKVYIQKKQSNGTFINLKESNCPLDATIWINLTGVIEPGTYRITTSIARYPVFSEFFAQKMIVNKALILHDGEYKQYASTIIDSIEPDSPIVSLVPNLSSNVSANGTASSSSEIAGWQASNAFYDNVDNNGWQATVKAGWLQFQFPGQKKMKVVKYSMKPVFYQSNITWVQRMPKTWIFEGSNNGTEFIELSKIESFTSWTLTGEISFDITSPDYYNFYRIRVLDNNGHPSYLAIGLLKLFGKNITSNDLIPVYETKWSTVSTILPTSQQFIEHGMDSLSPLLDRRIEELKPLTMTNNSEISGVGEEGKVFSQALNLK